jgi:hypothetical protein
LEKFLILFHLQNSITNLKIEIAQPVVQVQANQIFNFPEAVKFLVILSSRKGTLEFSFHYMEIVITQRKDPPAYDPTWMSICSTKEQEFKQESYSVFHIVPVREYLWKIFKKENMEMVVFLKHAVSSYAIR